MGTTNRDLLVRWGRAKRAGDRAEMQRLSQLIMASQEACPHPDGETRCVTAPSDSGKYKRGDTIIDCLACSKVLIHVQNTTQQEWHEYTFYGPQQKGPTT